MRKAFWSSSAIIVLISKRWCWTTWSIGGLFLSCRISTEGKPTCTLLIVDKGFAKDREWCGGYDWIYWQVHFLLFWSHYLDIWMKINTQNTVYKIIHEELKTMETGEEIDFREFLVWLKLTCDDYILAIRSSLKSVTIFLKRTPSEIRVNAYNPGLIKAWKANTDIQFVTNIYACAMYIASHVTKSQGGMSGLLRKAAD